MQGFSLGVRRVRVQRFRGSEVFCAALAVVQSRCCMRKTLEGVLRIMMEAREVRSSMIWKNACRSEYGTSLRTP